jgi:polysaccharide export outer membrane protein
MRRLIFLALLPLLVGCVPSNGPGSRAIVSDGKLVDPPFALISLNQGVAERLASQRAPNLAEKFGVGTAAPTLTLGVGDVVIVTIFEAAAGGLFSGETGSVGGTKNVNLPPQPVTREGTISVPYVGQVRAAGLTPAEVGKVIQTALKDKAIEPQVIVTVASSPSNFVTMAGDIGVPGQLPLALGGSRLLDTISVAGGPKGAYYNTFVTLTRKGGSVTVNLGEIVRDPRQNIYLQPNDLIYVNVDPQVYMAFGATGRNATVPFSTDRLTLAEAVGQAGGLSDLRADPRGVFVFRYEDPDIYAAIRAIEPDALGSPATTSVGVPVVYRIDMDDPQTFFVAQRFLMRNSDVMYVSTATSVELQKLLNVFTGSLGGVNALGALETRFVP